MPFHAYILLFHYYLYLLTTIYIWDAAMRAAARSMTYIRVTYMLFICLRFVELSPPCHLFAFFIMTYVINCPPLLVFSHYIYIILYFVLLFFHYWHYTYTLVSWSILLLHILFIIMRVPESAFSIIADIFMVAISASSAEFVIISCHATYYYILLLLFAIEILLILHELLEPLSHYYFIYCCQHMNETLLYFFPFSHITFYIEETEHFVILLLYIYSVFLSLYTYTFFFMPPCLHICFLPVLPFFYTILWRHIFSPHISGCFIAMPSFVCCCHYYYYLHFYTCYFLRHAMFSETLVILAFHAFKKLKLFYFIISYERARAFFTIFTSLHITVLPPLLCHAAIYYAACLVCFH